MLRYFFMKKYYVYIITNVRNTVLYIGVTGNLYERLVQHREGHLGGFTQKYKLIKLVYLEEFDNPYDAISREKQLKNWRRQWKRNLIENLNPEWDDLNYHNLL